MSFWNGKRVFLTGHTGFKGSWLTKLLLLRGAKVFGYALPPPSQPSIYSESKELQDIPQVINDIRDGSALKAAMSKFKPDVVLHLAAQALVRDSYRDPVTTFESNVLGAVHLFEAVRATDSVVSVVNVTSDKCYDNREWNWGYRENEAMGGKDPYSASKGCAELVTASYRSSFFNNGKVRLASARAGNVYGGGDWANDRLIPDLVRAFSLRETAIIRSPKSVRPWQFVLEPLVGYLDLAEKNFTTTGYDEGWNFGPSDSDAKDVAWIADKLKEQWGQGADFDIVTSDDNMKEASLLRLDCTKARTQLGWRPRLPLSEGLEWTIDFYKSFYEGTKKMDLLLEEQINMFEQRGRTP
ncbi:MAG: CDP-glucose 4,6-dehydratase [Bdellovibrionales bacterium]|nr:CDP-glucose 4,6-dehydratase [Bdellovibrionales bacterium]